MSPLVGEASDAATSAWEKGVDAIFFGPTGEVKQSRFVVDFRSGVLKRARLGNFVGADLEKVDHNSGNIHDIGVKIQQRKPCRH